jgi:hypothetical protein
MKRADPREIAKGLTKAQRAALLKARQVYAGNNQRWFVHPHGRAVKGCCAKGLADYEYLPARVTSLGLAVRAILEAQHD